MAGPQVRILVVDDERNIRNNLGMVLEAEGYKVDTASNGDDALTKVKEGLYDIAFVDIQMPKMNGLELLGYLRGIRPNLAVVILTAYGFYRKTLRSQGGAAALQRDFGATKNRHEWHRRRAAAFGRARARAKSVHRSAALLEDRDAAGLEPARALLSAGRAGRNRRTHRPCGTLLLHGARRPVGL